MGIDVYALLSCPPSVARRALGDRDVIRVGRRACLVGTPDKWPRSPEQWVELATRVGDLAARTGHDDVRGVLVLPDESALELAEAARSYDAFVELAGSGGYWLRAGASPRRAARTKAAEERPRMATMPPDEPVDARSKLTCFVFPPGAPDFPRKPVAFVEMARLSDGTLIVVIREPFSDPEALLRFFVHYPALSRIATDPRGLLAIPASAYRAAARLASYDEVVRLHGAEVTARGKTPKRYRLRVDDVAALRAALEA